MAAWTDQRHRSSSVTYRVNSYWRIFKTANSLCQPNVAFEKVFGGACHTKTYQDLHHKVEHFRPKPSRELLISPEPQ